MSPGTTELVDRFESLATAGVAAAVLAERSFADSAIDLVVALESFAFPVDVSEFVDPVAAHLGRPVVLIKVGPGEAGELAVSRERGVALGARVLVVTPVVETGQSAMAAAAELVDAGAQLVGLLTAVCSRESEAVLRLRYSQIAALHRPLARRSGRWHFVSLKPEPGR